MEWTFFIGNKQYSATYRDGVFETTNPLLKFTVNHLIENMVAVRPGYMAPLRPASLIDDAIAWGTISRAVRMISSERKNTFPIIDEGLEVFETES